MKHAIALALLIGVSGHLSNRIVSGRDYPIWPWSEGSHFVRIGKAVLPELSVPSLEVRDYVSMDLALNEKFIKVFRLTELEIRQISAGLTNAQHRCRMLERDYLEPISELEAGEFMPREKGDQIFNFRVKPFLLSSETANIRQEFKRVVISAIGNERGFFFFENGAPLEAMFRGTGGMIYSYLFPAIAPGEVYRFSYNAGCGGHSGLFVSQLDRYAPESLKSILERWRAREKSHGTGAATRPVELRPEAERASTDNGTWDEQSPYVEIPKELLSTFVILGLMPDGTMNPQIAALLGLSSGEQNSVMKLYREMKRRFESVERLHLTRIEQGKNRFRLGTFPEKSADLRSEWSSELKALLGEVRANLLDRAFQRDYAALEMPKRRDLLKLYLESEPPWFHRGGCEILFDFKVLDDMDRGFRIGYKVIYSGTAVVESSGTSPDIPDKWHHLITLEMLE